MLRCILLAVVVAVALVPAPARGILFTEKDLASEESLRALYCRWRGRYTVSRPHELGDDDMARRLNVFKENVHYIHEANKKERPFKLALNKFADMTTDEFRRSYAGLTVRHHRALSGAGAGGGIRYADDADEVASAVDWREKGAVTRIKDQGQCCTERLGLLGGRCRSTTGKLVSLSEQELMDCNDHTNNGCNGGDMEHAFQFIKENGGITTESNYPYLAKETNCNKTKENSHEVTIDGYEVVPADDEEALMKAVSNSKQPVSVAIDVSGEDFQFYSEGVFTGECTTGLNHGVAAVGYGTTKDGTKYWIVKNSWGKDWGESGYIRMQRGISAAEGQCGIAMQASYPTKSAAHMEVL